MRRGQAGGRSTRLVPPEQSGVAKRCALSAAALHKGLLFEGGYASNLKGQADSRTGAGCAGDRRAADQHGSCHRSQSGVAKRCALSAAALQKGLLFEGGFQSG